MSSVCVLVSTPPSPDPEVIEMILALAAFEHDVSVVFRGAGTGWLLKEQTSRKPGGKSPARVLSALPMYDVDQIGYCVNDALAVNAGDLLSLAKPMSDDMIRSLINNSDFCLSF